MKRYLVKVNWGVRFHTKSVEARHAADAAERVLRYLGRTWETVDKVWAEELAR